MADTGERLPDFPNNEYDAFRQRSLTEIVERRLRAINNSLLELEQQVELTIGQGGTFAPINHTHVEADITDLQPYLLDITGQSIGDLSDVDLTGVQNGYVLKYNSGVWTPQAESGGGGGGGGFRYIGFRDTSGNSTSLSSDEYFRFRSANTMLSLLVENDNATFGDNLLLTINNDQIDHDALNNYVADQHIAHSGVSLTAGAGLTGGGDITANRSFAVGAGTGIAVNADDVALNFSGLSSQTIAASDLLAFYDGATHVQDTWTNLQLTISITESQISDLKNYAEVDQTETITGAWSFNTNLPTSSLTPSSPSELVTKLYVDNLAAGLKWKPAALVATTANITLSGTQTIDGVGVVADDRVLVKDQTLPEENGIYVVAAGAWTRATDADTWDELVSAAIFVSEGTTQQDTGWTCTSDAGGTLGTSAVDWSQFTGGGGGGTLAGLTDVTITSPADGVLLRYDNVGGEWINDNRFLAKTNGLAPLFQVDSTGDTNGGYMRWVKGDTQTVNWEFYVFNTSAGNRRHTIRFSSAEELAFIDQNNATWLSKGPLSTSYPTFGTKAVFQPSSTTRATVTFPVTGTAPTTPAEGDFWVTQGAAKGVFIRIQSNTYEIPLLQNTLGKTWTAKQTFRAATSDEASITLPHGSAPVSPVNGDTWTTTAGMYVRINGSTVGPLSAGGGVSALNDLSDVNTSGITANDLLFNNAGTWQPTAGNLSWTGLQMTVVGDIEVRNGNYVRINETGNTNYMLMDVQASAARLFISGKTDLAVSGVTTIHFSGDLYPDGNTVGYITSPPNNTYGSIHVIGAQRTLAGYGIGGATGAGFYLNAPFYGLYDEVNNAWGLLCRQGQGVDLYYNGSIYLSVKSGTSVGATSAADLRHYNTTSYDIGFNVNPSFTQDATFSDSTTWRNAAGMTLRHTSATAHTYTIPDTTQLQIGFVVSVDNVGTGAVTIATGGTATLTWMDGSGSTGSRTLSQYGSCMLKKVSTTSWQIVGTGLT